MFFSFFKVTIKNPALSLAFYRIQTSGVSTKPGGPPGVFACGEKRFVYLTKRRQKRGGPRHDTLEPRASVPWVRWWSSQGGLLTQDPRQGQLQETRVQACRRVVGRQDSEAPRKFCCSHTGVRGLDTEQGILGAPASTHLHANPADETRPWGDGGTGLLPVRAAMSLCFCGT